MFLLTGLLLGDFLGLAVVAAAFRFAGVPLGDLVVVFCLIGVPLGDFTGVLLGDFEFTFAFCLTGVPLVDFSVAFCLTVVLLDNCAPAFCPRTAFLGDFVGLADRFTGLPLGDFLGLSEGLIAFRFTGVQVPFEDCFLTGVLLSDLAAVLLLTGEALGDFVGLTDGNFRFLGDTEGLSFFA